MKEEYAVEMRGIDKVYPNGIAANKDVEFSVLKGEIHALMGENGAGKSTLMKMLFGIEEPTKGEIKINGESVKLSGPQSALTKGVGMVHQHFMLVPSLTVAENIVLGMTPRKKGIFIDYSEAVKITEEASKKYNLKVDPDAKVADIPVGMKQKVEILKALVRGAKILILDEPTAVLTSQETDELFHELKFLKSEGYTIIFISHKLREIKALTDRLTILRDGRTIGTYNTSEVSEQDISRMMVGRDVDLTVEKDEAKPGKVVLSVRDLEFTSEWGKKMCDKISFDLREGEILGIAGVEGNGQAELVQMLFNLTTPHGGTIKVHGKDTTKLSHRKLREEGITLIPEDRMTYGIAGDGTIEENILSDRAHHKRFNRGLLFKMPAIHEESATLVEEYQILAKSPQQRVKMLSGGNIQKVVVAREFSAEPKLIIADQPTRGIDVGAAEFIHKKLVELSREGTAVLLVSADLNEVLALSDSLMVFAEGRIVAYFPDTEGLNDVILGEYMLGIKEQTPEETRRVLHEK